MKCTAVFVAALTALTVQARADVLAAKGAKGTLEVEYVFESSGKKADQNDSREWRTKRTLKLTADLAAQAPGPYSSLHDMNAGEKTDLNKTQAAAKSAQQKMAPTSDAIEKIMKKCGEDEACISREVQALGFSMQGDPQIESAKKDVAVATKQGAATYQTWRPTLQKGTYTIDEFAHNVLADPICPNLHCTTDETRKGSGEVALPPGAKPEAAAGLSAVEVDSTGKTLTVVLPVPLFPLPYTETVKTNSPDKKSGTSQGMLRFPPNDLKPLKVALKGDGRDQSGTETLPVPEGTLTVRWKWTAR
jgi:hypothetical protein